MDQKLLTRIDRLESIHAIQQLAIRYAIAVDSRDIDGWLNLFVPNVDCGKRGIGREALRPRITQSLSNTYRSIHQICGHRIDFDDADHAQGKVYCRAENERQRKWIVQAICYFDTYLRVDGEWFFVRRRDLHWYDADVTEGPKAPFKATPGQTREPLPLLPGAFKHWHQFWAEQDPEHINNLTELPATNSAVE